VPLDTVLVRTIEIGGILAIFFPNFRRISLKLVFFGNFGFFNILEVFSNTSSDIRLTKKVLKC
jgi:hypothetical protein